MKKITAIQCEDCDRVFTTEEAYNGHLDACKKAIALGKELAEFDRKFPEVKSEDCSFGNGEYSVQRTKEWFMAYEQALLTLIAKHHKYPYQPMTYGWFRCLDDGGSPFYGRALRMTWICKKCWREWGQAFYANNCKHQAGEDFQNIIRK